MMIKDCTTKSMQPNGPVNTESGVRTRLKINEFFVDFYFFTKPPEQKSAPSLDHLRTCIDLLNDDSMRLDVGWTK